MHLKTDKYLNNFYLRDLNNFYLLFFKLFILGGLMVH